MQLTDNYYNKFNKILAFCLAVLCLAIGCSLAAISRSHSLTDTYDAGEVCDLSGKEIVLDAENDYTAIFDTAEDPLEWKYVYIDLTGSDGAACNFRGETLIDGQPTGEVYDVELSAGYNVIELNGEACDSLQMTYTTGQESKLTTKFVEFRENAYTFSFSEFLLYIGAFSLIFAVIGMMLNAIKRKCALKIDWYAPIDLLQMLYIWFGNKLAAIAGKVPDRLKRILRIAAFVCWMFWIMMMYNMGKYVLTVYFRFNVVLFCIVMFLIAVSLLKEPLKKQDWNIPLVHAWFWLSICMCISELFIAKRFCMIGYVNLIFFGFYYFVWCNLKDRNTVVSEIIIAFKVAFCISFVFTLLFRPRIYWFGLNGHTWNPNIYGIFCSLVLFAFLACIRNHIVKKQYGWKFVLNTIGAMAALSFVLLSLSRAGLIMCFAGMLFFIIEYAYAVKCRVIAPGKGIIAAVLFGVAFLACHMALSWATVNMPIVGIVFPWDDRVPEGYIETIIVLGMDTPAFQNAVFDPAVSGFLSGRNFYWIEYLREINFMGHDYYPKMWGAARNPHNGVLGIVYRYGILAAVPYIIMFVNAIVIAFKRFADNRKSEGHSFYIWICVIGISLCMLIENFERPFLATEWLWWYWCLGFLFMKEERELLEGGQMT